MTWHALVVDDEADLLEVIRLGLTRMGGEVSLAASLQEAEACLHGSRFDLCLMDLRLPDGNGLDLLQRLGTRHPELPVVVITAYGSARTAVDCLKAGARDFIEKPIDLKALRQVVQAVLRRPLQRQGSNVNHIQLIGQSRAMGQLRHLLSRFSHSQAPVHVRGESGTGKELVARTIHEHSGRHPFVAVNCAALPADLMESEFFGYSKGAFTGAVQDRPGLFQLASGGTLFLDEMGELPLGMQAKLLRAVQERRIRPVGSGQEVTVDVRLISATHQDLAIQVKKGAFRADLYYRLVVLELTVPPLRERLDDIPELAAFLLERIGQRESRSGKSLTDEALHALCRHTFPGNVRELENILERAVALSSDTMIGLDDLLLPDPPAHEEPTDDPDLDFPLSAQVDDHEAALIRQALQAARYNKTKAAKALGISFRSLRYRIKKLGIE
jgi:two-component system response regulator PilR (NtrC family)